MKKVRKKLGKALSLGLVSSMVMSPVSVLADSANVTETQQVSSNSNAETNVTINGVESSFSITVPKLITGTGDSGNLGYTVDIEGDIAGNQQVYAIPDESVALKQDRKTDVTAGITQDKTVWKADELDVQGNGNISYSGLSSGTWSGNFNFNIGIRDNSYIPISVVDSEGTDLNASASLITGTKADELLSKLVESGNINSVDDVDLLVDVKADSFDDISTATFDVSSIASEGEKVAILHYNHDNEWELIAVEEVSSEGTIRGNFSNYSPVAFVKVTEEGSLGEVIEKSLEAGLYDADNNLLVPLTAERVQVNGVNSLASSLGLDSSSVYKAVLPEGTTRIGDYAFYCCTNLTSVTIPDSVASIGGSAFSGCNSLTSVTIPNSVTSIGDSAFSGCENLTSVTIPNSVTSIGVWAFSSCNSLTSVTIPDSVTEIGVWAFNNCRNLTSVTISNNITTLDSTFGGCTSLTTVTIPNSVLVINNAFHGCSSLTSITIPNSVTSIDGSAFSECNSLTSVTIPDSVTKIGNNTFCNCTALTSITIPNSVISIGYSAFEGCTNLTSITIPNSVISIGNKAFCRCTRLKSITLPNSIATIDFCAFYGCSSLSSVTIPDSVTSIGENAFYKVPHIYYNGTATGSPWGAKAIN